MTNGIYFFFFRNVAAFLLIFGIVYNVSFISYEQLGSARISAAILIFWACFFYKDKIDIDWRIFVLFAAFPCSLVQYLFAFDFGQPGRFIYLFLYSFLGGIIVANFVSDFQRLLKIFLLVITFQSLILIFSFFSIDYRLWIGGLVAVGSNFDAEHLYRAPGFTSNAGSALSVIQSIGVLAGVILLWFRKKNKDFSSSYGVVLMMLLCMFSCVVVGRTGLILSMLYFALCVLSGWLDRRMVFWAIFISLFFVYLAIEKSAAFLSEDFSVDYFTGWAFGFFSGNDGVVTELSSLPIPPLRLDTIFGTGLVSIDAYGANPSGHDSGFIQSYYSLGLIFSIVLYSSYIYVLYRLVGRLPRLMAIVIVSSVFFIEIKEPFLFKYSIVFFLVAVFCSQRLDENKKAIRSQ